MKNRDDIKLNPKPMFYATILESLRKTCLDYGYALAVHGSCSRDMDLIAVAWTDSAIKPDLLIDEIQKCLFATIYNKDINKDGLLRSHGRVTYTIAIQDDWFIDFTVIHNYNFVLHSCFHKLGGDIIVDLVNTLTNVSQLIRGWNAAEIEWSNFDETVYRDVASKLRLLERIKTNDDKGNL